MQTLYKAFVDESGQREYGPKTDRYYVVAGAIVPVNLIKRYETELAGLKRAFFGKRKVELKSNWLRQPAERRKHYTRPYGISSARLKTLVDLLYDWVCATRVTFIAGVVDKHQMEEKYADPHHPSAVGYQIFLQRYQKFLKTRGCLGAVLMDDLSGKSKAGNEWKRLLQKQHVKLLRYGCNYTRLRFTNLQDSITFGNSENEPLVQLADIAAYNTFRQFRKHGTVWDDPAAKQLPVYEYFDRLLPRFHQSRDGVFAGYGVAKMPRQTRHAWLVK